MSGGLQARVVEILTLRWSSRSYKSLKTRGSRSYGSCPAIVQELLRQFVGSEAALLAHPTGQGLQRETHKALDDRRLNDRAAGIDHDVHGHGATGQPVGLHLEFSGCP